MMETPGYYAAQLWEDLPPVALPRAPAQPARPPHTSALHSSESNEWYTPRAIVEAARAVMGDIDLDPASCGIANRTVRARRFYSDLDDGLQQPWGAPEAPMRVWMNPPYGKTAGESNQAIWTARLIAEYRAGNVVQAVALVNAVPGNAWFAPLWDFPICFVARRIRFVSAAGQPMDSPTHSNALIYLGAAIPAFITAFSPFGPVVGRLDSR